MARRHATTADFDLVGMDADPTPGDPEEVQAVVKRYGDIGDAARSAADVLKKNGALSTGRGAAMDALREKVGDDLPDKLNKTATSYDDAANALKAYLPQLEEAQDTFDRAVEQARTAAPQANQTVAALPADATDDQKAAHGKQQQDVDAAQDSMSAARSLAEQARSLREAAANRCANALDAAAGEAIPERNLFQKISDFFEDFPFVKILIGALLAILTIFFPVVGLLLGAAFLAFTTIVDIASGHFSIGDLLVGLLSLIPGGALLKLAGPALKAGLSLGAKLAPQLAKTAKGGLNGIKTSFNSGKTVGNAGKAAGAAAGNFGEGAAGEAVNETANGQPLSAGSILGAGAAGLLGFGGKKKGGGVSNKIDQGPSRAMPGPGESAERFPPPGKYGLTDAFFRPTPTPAGQIPSHFKIPKKDGGVDLTQQEHPIGAGHTLLKHSGLSQAELDKRVKSGPNQISTFHDLATAQKATSDNITANELKVSKLKAFGKDAAPPAKATREVIEHFPANASTLGTSRVRTGPKGTGTIASAPVSGVRTIIDRDSTSPGGIKIITSYPI